MVVVAKKEARTFAGNGEEVAYQKLVHSTTRLYGSTVVRSPGISFLGWQPFDLQP